jgi:hypothetical protein
MYSTVSPFGIAVDVELGDEVADHGQVEGFRHAGNLHPLGDAARAQEVDHHDVDRPVLEHVAERHDAVVILAGGDGGDEVVGHSGQPGEIVMGHRVF